MVKIRSSGLHPTNLAERIQVKMSRNRRNKRGIAAAFTPGLLKFNTSDESARKILFQHYHLVIHRCGFLKGRSTSRETPPVWRVSVNPSSSFEVQINFDCDMKVLKVCERPLNWVHGTILDGKKQHFNGSLRTNADVRILISTEEKVGSGTDLYRSVFPGDKPPLLIKNGKPVLPTFVDGSRAKKRNFVTMVRNIETTDIFTDGVCDACIVKGTVYFGKDLLITRSFCELSLYFDVEPLRESIRTNLNDELMETYSRTLFKTSNKIKEELDSILTEPTD